MLLAEKREFTFEYESVCEAVKLTVCEICGCPADGSTELANCDNSFLIIAIAFEL